MGIIHTLHYKMLISHVKKEGSCNWPVAANENKWMNQSVDNIKIEEV